LLGLIKFKEERWDEAKRLFEEAKEGKLEGDQADDIEEKLKVIEEKSFRRDLLYRLNTVIIELPPLRERRDEIKPLAELFLARFCESHDRPRKTIGPAAMKILRKHDWPGNIRQLKNAVERSAILVPGNVITASILRPALTETRGLDRVRPTPRKDESDLSFQERNEQWEKDVLSEALLATGGNQTAAARYLRMPRRTLVHKLGVYGLTGKLQLARNSS